VKQMDICPPRVVMKPPPRMDQRKGRGTPIGFAQEYRDPRIRKVKDVRQEINIGNICIAVMFTERCDVIGDIGNVISGCGSDNVGHVMGKPVKCVLKNILLNKTSPLSLWPIQQPI
jgi:hypothetical protein